MSAEQAWVDETLELIRHLENEGRARAEARIAVAQQSLDAVNHRIDALYTALDVYRAAHGLEAKEHASVDPAVLASFQGLRPKEMLTHWAATHGGLVIMREAMWILVAAGLFRDLTQANGTLYPTISRWDDFEKVRRGVYRWKHYPEPDDEVAE